MQTELPKNMEGLSVVTEQGMFGELGVKDPNVRDLDKKKKKKKHQGHEQSEED